MPFLGRDGAHRFLGRRTFVLWGEVPLSLRHESLEGPTLPLVLSLVWGPVRLDRGWSCTECNQGRGECTKRRAPWPFPLRTPKGGERRSRKSWRP